LHDGIAGEKVITGTPASSEYPDPATRDGFDDVETIKRRLGCQSARDEGVFHEWSFGKAQRLE